MMSEQDEGGFDAIMELGVVLSVADLERAVEFYTEFLGFEVTGEEDPSGDDRRVVTLRYGNAVLDLVERERSGQRQNFRLVWTVGDIDAAVEHLRAGGGSIVRPMEYGMYCADPDGNLILVKQMEMDPNTAQELFF